MLGPILRYLAAPLIKSLLVLLYFAFIVLEVLVLPFRSGENTTSARDLVNMFRKFIATSDVWIGVFIGRFISPPSRHMSGYRLGKYLLFCVKYRAYWNDHMIANRRHTQMIGWNFSGAWCRYATIEGRDLDGLILDRSDLMGIVFDRVDLSGSRLNQSNMSGAQLRRVKLVGADLKEATLQGAYLLEVDLSNTRIDNANMSGICLENCKLKGTQLSWNSIYGGKITGLDLEGHKAAVAICFRGAELTNLNLHCADIRGADMRNCTLTRVSMGRADLRAVQLEGSTFEECVFTDCLYDCLTVWPGPPPEGARLICVGALLRGMSLWGADLSRVDMTGADLTLARLCWVNMKEANLRDSMFDNANLDRIDLTSSDLTGASLRETHLTKVELKGANLRGTVLDKATLEELDLTSTELVGANLRGVRLLNVNLTNVSLRGLVLDNAVFQGLDLVSTDLVGASLRDVHLTDVTLPSCLDGVDLRGVKGLPRAFCGVSLKGADLREQNLAGVDFSGADLTGTRVLNADFNGAYLYGARVSLVGMPKDVRGCRLLAKDTERARWTLEQYKDWIRNGAVFDDLGELPEEIKSWLGESQGLTIYLRTPLAPVDHLLILGVIHGTLGPDTECRVLSLNQSEHSATVTLGAPERSELLAVAEALHERVWEQQYRALSTQASRVFEFPLVEAYRQALTTLHDNLDEVVLRFGAQRRSWYYYDVFISYSRTDVDMQFAHLLEKTLSAVGVRCWLDEHELEPGLDAREQVFDAIRTSRKVLLCCSAASSQSYWVRDEILKTLDREKRGDSGVLIPLLIEPGILDDWNDGLGSSIRSRICVNLSNWQGDSSVFNAGVQKVLRAVYNGVAGSLLAGRENYSPV